MYLGNSPGRRVGKVAFCNGPALSRTFIQHFFHQLSSYSDWLQTVRPEVDSWRGQRFSPQSRPSQLPVQCVPMVHAGQSSNRGSIPYRDKRYLSSQRPRRLCSPPNLLSSVYRGRGVKLTTHHLVPRVRIPGIYLHFLIRLHGLVLNETQENILPGVLIPGVQRPGGEAA
jgi:hypothetical protein